MHFLDCAQQLVVLHCLGQHPSQQVLHTPRKTELGIAVADLLLLVRFIAIVVRFALSPDIAILPSPPSRLVLARSRAES